MKHASWPLLGLLVLSSITVLGQRQDPLDFLTGHTDFENLRNELANRVRGEAVGLLEQRSRKVQGFTAADIAGRKTYVRQRMLQAIGGLPERTPLNAKVVGTLERTAYRIEKIIFESQPGFYVTANLYLPKQGRAPYPGILYPLGHETGGKSNPTWQQMLGSLATKGYVALAWDPIGQGERVQLWDDDFRNSKVVRSTTEHTVLGTQLLLTGDNLARYTIWDGIRALDYLTSRPEVDAKRIGCTGNSGGGTHTAYLSALDDRIQVAAPSCYITSWRRLLETIGPQDAEQNLPPWIADGLDHGDFIQAFAPKPYLVLSAIRDFFSITGARETGAEARRIYDVLNASEKFARFEADDGHGYNKERRLAAYQWFGRWLKGAEDNAPEPDVELATEEELRCTPTGQVATSLQGESVYSLNRKRFEALKREGSGVSKQEIARLIAHHPGTEPVRTQPFGTLKRTGYRIEKLTYQSEPGVHVPALLYVPDAPSGRKPALLFVDGDGKTAASKDLETIAKKGMVILAIDARGFGETRQAKDSNGSDWPRYFGDFETGMTALLMGKTLMGMRTADITRGIDVLAARAEVDPGRIYGLGRNAAAVPMLHAAVLDERIARLGLDNMLLSYEAVVTRRINRGVFEDVIQGVLRHYDLPDLTAKLGSRPVTIVDLVDPVGELVPVQEAAAAYHTSVERSRPEQGLDATFQALLR